MSEDEVSARVARLAAAVGLVVPPECVAGVAASLDLLAEHAARLHELPLDGDIA